MNHRENVGLLNTKFGMYINRFEAATTAVPGTHWERNLELYKSVREDIEQSLSVWDGTYKRPRWDIDQYLGIMSKEQFSAKAVDLVPTEIVTQFAETLDDFIVSTSTEGLIQAITFDPTASYLVEKLLNPDFVGDNRDVLARIQDIELAQNLYMRAFVKAKCEILGKPVPPEAQ